MARCPACLFENPDGVLECQRCHLAKDLFEAVQEAAGEPRSDPSYLQAIGDILSAVDSAERVSADEPESTNEVSGLLASPGRFPSMPAPKPPTSELPRGPDASPGLPALPPAADLPRLTRQVNEFVHLARRQGIDATHFEETAQRAAATQDRMSLEAISRDLFIRLAASLTEEFDQVLARRNELAALVATASPDVELESCRGALSMGDLAGAQRRLQHIEQELSDLEDQWATVQILVAECDLLAGTIRELGTDPGPALGPLAEGRRLALAGEREAAEPVLARAALALWSVLDAPFLRELAQIKDTILAQRRGGADVSAAVLQLRQLAADLRHRNFASAITAYRNLRELARSPAAPAERAPPPETPLDSVAPGSGTDS